MARKPYPPPEDFPHGVPSKRNAVPKRAQAPKDAPHAQKQPALCSRWPEHAQEAPVEAVGAAERRRRREDPEEGEFGAGPLKYQALGSSCAARGYDIGQERYNGDQTDDPEGKPNARRACWDRNLCRKRLIHFVAPDRHNAGVQHADCNAGRLPIRQHLREGFVRCTTPGASWLTAKWQLYGGRGRQLSHKAAASRVERHNAGRWLSDSHGRRGRRCATNVRWGRIVRRRRYRSGAQGRAEGSGCCSCAGSTTSQGGGRTPSSVGHRSSA